MSAPTAQSGESLSPEFFRATEEGIESGIDRIWDRYELQTNPAEWLMYHNSQHTKEVIEATGLILTTLQEADPDLGISMRDVQMGRLIAAWHDVVQGSDIIEADEGLLIRKFQRGVNEDKSLLELNAFMEGAGVFEPDDFETAKQGILGTITDVDMRVGRLSQPGAGDTTASIVARAVSMADLSATPGIRGPEAFLREGRVNYVEQYPALTDPQGTRRLIERHGMTLVRHAQHWLAMQHVHVLARKDGFAEEIADLSPDAQAAMHDLFGSFDDSAREAEAIAHQMSRHNPTDVFAYMAQDSMPWNR